MALRENEARNRNNHFTISTEKMEEQSSGDRGEIGSGKSVFDGTAHWWWAIGSGAQILWGVRSIKRGYAGDNRFMPLKAFGVASLFVGAIATTSVAFLRFSGIHSVEDAIEMGANLRTNLGVPSRVPENQINGRDDLS